ncbi:F0F1 ATP synthase subunit A [Eremococcus coleocola]|uniref:F0F1 ATP synthase subunit A n=1 Tax=Eremococcus coleocola TaxID=88132 RepID=UPI0004088BB0|nr:F0F1 ATP synthase subunit A [Eremococcus coleocola]
MDGTVVINLLGIPVGLNVVLSMIAAVVIVIALCFLFTRNLSVENPGKIQLAFEWIVNLVEGVVKDALGDSMEPAHMVVAITVFLFILVSNLLGLPILVEADGISYWKSPTAELAVCLAMAVSMNLISQYFGIKKYGLLQHFRLTYAQPVALLPYNILEEVINMMTLSLRLFGNIFAGEILLKLIAELGNVFGIATWPIGIPLQMVWQAFSVFIGCLQAYIFVNLSIVYLSHKVIHHVEEKEEA